MKSPLERLAVRRPARFVKKGMRGVLAFYKECSAGIAAGLIPVRPSARDKPTDSPARTR
ncbi:MAG: hypothetical protein JW839_12275 [Candidatus Lokiarchaeota archaeon]|nr:hypothetical protein [Candidatus Lokiarchaeota archaeon]